MAFHLDASVVVLEDFFSVSNVKLKRGLWGTAAGRRRSMA